MADSRQAHALFVQLMRDVYKELQCEAEELDFDPDLPLTFDLDVEGIGFTVSFDPSQSLERIQIFCPFGPVPEHIERAVLYRLMEVNLMLATTQMAIIGFDAETRNVVYHFQILLAGLTARSFLDALLLAAEQSKQWQATHFMDDEDIQQSKDDLANQLTV